MMQCLNSSAAEPIPFRGSPFCPMFMEKLNEDLKTKWTEDDNRELQEGRKIG